MTNEKDPIGILLVNLGTPAAPTKKALRPYLREFLSDRRVIDYPRWLWYPLLHGVILNVRPRKSAAAYADVWTDEGSPLMVYSRRVAEQMEAELLATWRQPVRVVLAMRYGQPSIAQGLASLREAGVRRILILPMYPQYSVTTVGTTFDAVFDELKRWAWMPEIRTVHEYCRHPRYIGAIADTVRDHWIRHGPPAADGSEKLIISMHGVPARYTRKGDPYECQCKDTAALIASDLQLNNEQWQLTFQSRFGPEPWLQPYTDETLKALGAGGTRRVDVVCPGFAADCLETLEEIDVENRAYFEAAGGEQFSYIPCLNDSPAHVDLFVALANEHCAGWVQSDPAPDGRRAPA
jgi:ferrochelatase